MTELRLHQELYRQTSVDEAVKMFERFGTLELSQVDPYWVVKIECKTSDRELRVRNELANFALGLTVKDLKS